MTLKTAIIKICDILEHPEYPQITTKLAAFNDEHECIGKCALGEISCKVGLELTYDNYNVSYNDILYKAGVPKYLLEKQNLPYMERKNREVRIEFHDSAGSDLDQYIWMMNDEGYTYDQISEFLRCTFLNDN